MITISQKIKVLDRWEELLKIKQKAREEAREPRPLGGSWQDKREWSKMTREAKQRKRFDILKVCRKEFPDIVQRAQPSKWKAACEREGWRELPEQLRERCTATSNTWRRALALPLKGRSEGGAVPMPIQRELDTLMVEFSSGMSAISERKELVTVEHIASCQTIL